ncbi:MAG: CbiM family transporter [Planctomycetota bacterium]
MHIVDGVLPAATWLGGWVAAVGGLSVSARRLAVEETPRIAVLSSAFFIASAFRIPLGPTSTHLLLHGLVGIVLGKRAFVAIGLGAALHFLILAQGGLTTLGVNMAVLGFPAMIGGWLFRRFRVHASQRLLPALAAATTLVTMALSIVAHAGVLLTGGRRFEAVVVAMASAHVVVAIFEATMTALLVAFLVRVRPDLIAGEAPDAP